MKHQSMTTRIILFVVLSFSFFSCNKLESDSPLSFNRLVTVVDNDKYNSFTSIIEYEETLYLCYREGVSHEPTTDDGCGVVVIMKSIDEGLTWEEYARHEKPRYDIRDPKLMIGVDGKLQTTFVAIPVINGKLLYYNCINYVAEVSNNSINNFREMKINDEGFELGFWMWDLAANPKTNVVYATAYSLMVSIGDSYLLKSYDNINFEVVRKIERDSSMGEVSIAFYENGDMLLATRNDPIVNAKIGYSKSPYTDWSWQETYFYLGGPCIEIIDDDIYMGGRSFVHNKEKLSQILALYRQDCPSSNIETIYTDTRAAEDTGYPGMTKFKDKIFMSYYSDGSSNGRACIYVMIFDCKK